ncbi:MAG TPA: HU family DNA-binding protein [Pyrinomonadaceae bacterium]|nr:HU family DNA-binding protein [Pyrinomonadaceae bacterium]
MAAKKSAAAKPAANAAKAGKASTKAAPVAVKEKSLGELTSALAERTGTTKVQAKAFLDAHAKLLIDELKQSGSVQLAGIGKLKMGERAERQGRNPATGEAMTIKAAKTVRFSGGKSFKDSLNA